MQVHELIEKLKELDPHLTVADGAQFPTEAVGVDVVHGRRIQTKQPDGSYKTVETPYVALF